MWFKSPMSGECEECKESTDHIQAFQDVEGVNKFYFWCPPCRKADQELEAAHRGA